MDDSVTVTLVKRSTGFLRYKLAFSAPRQSFGPWEFDETARDFTVSALLSPLDVRNLVLTALERGTATSLTAR